MKVKILLIFLLSFLLVYSCRSKFKVSEKGKTEKVEIVKIDSTTESVDSSTIKVKEKEVVKKISDTNSNVGNVNIIGKSDSITPFIYHNIKNGDTLQSISIFGNAEFKINNKWNDTSVKDIIDKSVEKLNVLQEYSRKAVAKETINKTAEEIKKVNTEVKSTGGTFGTYTTIILIVIGIICAVWLFYYFGGQISLKKIFSNFVKQKNNE